MKDYALKGQEVNIFYSFKSLFVSHTSYWNTLKNEITGI